MEDLSRFQICFNGHANRRSTARYRRTTNMTRTVMSCWLEKGKLLLFLAAIAIASSFNTNDLDSKPSFAFNLPL